jgi:Na+/melibiose symporter-like transporter
MKTFKIIGFIAAAILIFFGVLFIWGAFSSQGGGGGWIVIGLISVAIGFVIIYFAARSRPAAGAGENVTYKIDLPGNVKLDSLKCQSCGGVLTADNIKMVNGAPMVNCPYCHTAYQLTEEPKW